MVERPLFSILIALFEYGNPRTEEFIRLNKLEGKCLPDGVWSFNDQATKMTEELGEVITAHKKEGFDHTIHEVIDDILAGVTMLTILMKLHGLTKTEMMMIIEEQANEVNRKLHTRLDDKCIKLTGRGCLIQ